MVGVESNTRGVERMTPYLFTAMKHLLLCTVSYLFYIQDQQENYSSSAFFFFFWPFWQNILLKPWSIKETISYFSYIMGRNVDSSLSLTLVNGNSIICEARETHYREENCTNFSASPVSSSLVSPFSLVGYDGWSKLLICWTTL